MTNIRRLGSILWALVTLIIAPLMIIFPELGYAIILCALAFSLTFKGLGTIIYYFRMARHMVGGKSILYQGVILFDLGMVTLSLSDVPKFYVLVYLAILHGFSGVVDILRANESKKLGENTGALSSHRASSTYSQPHFAYSSSTATSSR
ncbi:MAG: hypothetical protein K6C38_07920 [Saccharofermentans sp.]|nr:hypothetical protein [Saccharofermentans sp.]